MGELPENLTSGTKVWIVFKVEYICLPVSSRSDPEGGQMVAAALCVLLLFSLVFFFFIFWFLSGRLGFPGLMANQSLDTGMLAL